MTQAEHNELYRLSDLADKNYNLLLPRQKDRLLKLSEIYENDHTETWNNDDCGGSFHRSCVYRKRY